MLPSLRPIALRCLQPATGGNAVAQYAYLNSALGAATNETATVGGNTATLSRGLNNRQRLADISLARQLHATYSYDAESRLSAVSNAAFTVDYAYTPDGWDAGYAIRLTNGVVLTRALTRDPYRRHLVTSISNAVDDVRVYPLDYTYDFLNRVTSRNADTFGYNIRSDVTAADIQSTASRYAFDSIGNNLWTSFNSVTNTYTANALNQYTAINDTPLAYDGDGNLLTNGVWSYTWDCDNRLTAVYSNSVCVVSNAYDHAHRRVLKVTPATTCTYLYDGWNLIRETVQTSQSTVTNRFVWGRDLSGSMQGAGGIGGLLALISPDGTFYPCCDANGNITDYVNAASTVVARYEYSPFGEITAQSGPIADSFTHRFSTKPWCSVTGLSEYEFRKYGPGMGRWANRDPIGEEGGEILCGFVGNDGLGFVDYLGLRDFTVVMVGDSLTYGISDDRKRVPVPKGWPDDLALPIGSDQGWRALLVKLLNDWGQEQSEKHTFAARGRWGDSSHASYPGAYVSDIGAMLENRAPGGRSKPTIGDLGRLLDECEHAVIVVYFVGMNDAIRYAGSDTYSSAGGAVGGLGQKVFSGWKQGLQTAGTNLKDNDAILVAVSLPQTTKYIYDRKHRLNDVILGFNKLTASHTGPASSGVKKLVYQYADVSALPRTNTGDGLHFSMQDNKWVANTIRDSIVKGIGGL